MPDDYKEGQTATNPKTGQTVVYRGGQWVSAPPAPGAPVMAKKLTSTQDKELDRQRQGAAGAAEAKIRAAESVAALERLDSGPFRGAVLDMAIPTTGGGFWDGLGAAVVGAPMRMTGAINDKTIADYQTANRNATLDTRQSETGEKGVQTEGDAARTLLSTLTPHTADPQEIGKSINEKADRQIARTDFYTRWAQTYGSTAGVDEYGRSVEKAFSDHMIKGAPIVTKKPTIRRVQ